MRNELAASALHPASKDTWFLRQRSMEMTLTERIMQLRRSLQSPQWQQAMEYFAEHIGTDPELQASSEPTHEIDELVLCALQAIGRALFPNETGVEAGFLINKSARFNLYHGAGLVKSHLLMVLYLPDMELGCLMVIMDDTTQFARFRPNLLPGHKPSGGFGIDLNINLN